MTLNYNKKLSKLAVSSALSQSAIPVILCDENLLVCMISYGARKLYFPMQLGKKMTPFFPDDTLERLDGIDKGVLATELTRTGNKSTTLIVSDTAQGERYLALVVLPQIIFSHAKTPWYIDASFENLRLTINDLICSDRPQIERLDLCCSRISNLFSFWQEPFAGVIADKYASPSIYKQLATVVSECANVFQQIGGHVSAKHTDNISFTTEVHPRYVNIFSTTLLSLLVLISDDTNVHISSEIIKGEHGNITFSHSAATALIKKNAVNCIEDMYKPLPYLSAELAALKDLSERLGITLSCKTEENTLTVTYSLPINTCGTVIFHETDDNMPKRVRNLALALIREYLLDQKSTDK